MAQRNQWSPSRSSLLTINMWRRLQAKRTVLWLLPLLSSYFLILFRQDAMYVTAIVHARGSSTSLWYNLSFCHATMSLSLNQSPTTRGLVSSTGVRRVAIRAGATGIAVSSSSEMPAINGLATLEGGARTGTTASCSGVAVFESSLTLQVGKMATSPLPYRGSPPLQSGGQNQKWPTSGQSGYLTPAVWGIPTASERGAKSEVAHKWAKWLPHPCRIGDPHRFRAGGKIRSGPQVGKVATSPLPYRGSPPLQSGGQNQKWPTSGQSGYLTPAVWGIPTASERGAKSEVVPKRGPELLRNPCRLGDPQKGGGRHGPRSAGAKSPPGAFLKGCP